MPGAEDVLVAVLVRMAAAGLAVGQSPRRAGHSARSRRPRLAPDRRAGHQRRGHIGPFGGIPLARIVLALQPVRSQPTAGRGAALLLHPPPRIPLVPLLVRSMGYHYRQVVDNNCLHFQNFGSFVVIFFF